MTLTLHPDFSHNLQCFLGNGTVITTHKHHNTITVSSNEKLPPGRSRYTCTAESDEKGRFYWMSHQWIIH